MRVGRYEISELIGEGGMGRVFKARDTQLARIVAIKVLPAAFSTNQESLRRFEQEARATAALNHPGIMAVYDVGVHEGAPYLVSEFLEGATLRDRLAAGQLPLHTALEFAPPRRWRWRTRKGSSTGISSPRTSSSVRATASRSWTSVSPS